MEYDFFVFRTLHHLLTLVIDTDGVDLEWLKPCHDSILLELVRPSHDDIFLERRIPLERLLASGQSISCG
jgi:hypothetical protein